MAARLSALRAGRPLITVRLFDINLFLWYSNFCSRPYYYLIVLLRASCRAISIKLLHFNLIFRRYLLLHFQPQSMSSTFGQIDNTVLSFNGLYNVPFNFQWILVYEAVDEDAPLNALTHACAHIYFEKSIPVDQCCMICYHGDAQYRSMH